MVEWKFIEDTMYFQDAFQLQTKGNSKVPSTDVTIWCYHGYHYQSNPPAGGNPLNVPFQEPWL